MTAQRSLSCFVGVGGGREKLEESDRAAPPALTTHEVRAGTVLHGSGCAELDATGAGPQPASSTAGTHDLKGEEELDSTPTSPQRSLQSRVFEHPRLYANVMKAFMIVLETGGMAVP